MEPLSRPVPPLSPTARARAWLAWFGIARLVAASVATVLVCAGGIWLLSSPPPPTEASLPRAAVDTSVPGSVVGPTIAPAAPAPVPPAVTDTPPVPVVVHVAGSVVEPGVYELPPSARVRDAIVAGGGPTPDADWNALNLAAPLTDGSRVYVPAVGEEVTGALVSAGAPASAGGDGGETAAGPVDVNRATATELDALPGVGPSIATAIVTERDRNGPFVTVDDLERVPGIGPAKLEALRDLVTT